MGLGAELASKGIDVQAQTPLYVTTKMAKIRRSSMTVPQMQMMLLGLGSTFC